HEMAVGVVVGPAFRIGHREHHSLLWLEGAMFEPPGSGACSASLNERSARSGIERFLKPVKAALRRAPALMAACADMSGGLEEKRTFRSLSHAGNRRLSTPHNNRLQPIMQ